MVGQEKSPSPRQLGELAKLDVCPVAPTDLRWVLLGQILRIADQRIGALDQLEQSIGPQVVTLLVIAQIGDPAAVAAHAVPERATRVSSLRRHHLDVTNFETVTRGDDLEVDLRSKNLVHRDRKGGSRHLHDQGLTKPRWSDHGHAASRMVEG